MSLPFNLNRKSIVGITIISVTILYIHNNYASGLYLHSDTLVILYKRNSIFGLIHCSSLSVTFWIMAVSKSRTVLLLTDWYITCNLSIASINKLSSITEYTEKKMMCVGVCVSSCVNECIRFCPQIFFFLATVSAPKAQRKIYSAALMSYNHIYSPRFLFS